MSSLAGIMAGNGRGLILTVVIQIEKKREEEKITSTLLN